MGKATVMTKGALAAAIAEGCELKKGMGAQVISTLASIGTEETKKNGKFVIPGLVMIKTRKKPATKAAKKEMFGKTVLVKRGRRGRSSRLSPQRCSRMNSERLFFVLPRLGVPAGQVRGHARLVRQSA